jgi:hypothetical protein
MSVVSSATLNVDAIAPSTIPLPTPDRAANDIAITHLPRFASSAAESLRDASQRHEGEMNPPAAMIDNQLDHAARFPSHERMWSGARRTSRHGEWPMLAESHSVW